MTIYLYVIVIALGLCMSIGLIDPDLYLMICSSTAGYQMRATREGWNKMTAEDAIYLTLMTIAICAIFLLTHIPGFIWDKNAMQFKKGVNYGYSQTW